MLTTTFDLKARVEAMLSAEPKPVVMRVGFWSIWRRTIGLIVSGLPGN